MKNSNNLKHNTPILAITGGKGGTGKTLIATNLAIQFVNDGKRVLLVDCDVENPNTHILLNKSLDDSDVNANHVNMFLPQINPNLCSKCGKCHVSCYRHAILQLPQKFPSIMDHLCSGCGTCMKICPQKAISPSIRAIGMQYSIFNAYPNLDLYIGEVNPSEALSAVMVKELLENVHKFNSIHQYDLIILDTSPGAHCDVELCLENSDEVICVTEPTPFGEHDLGRILELTKLVGKTSHIILNRANMTDYREPIFNLTKKNSCILLGDIPLDDLVIENYVKGTPFVNDPRKFPAKDAFLRIYTHISHMLEERKK